MFTATPHPPSGGLTSPTAVVAVLAEEAALGVGDRCKVTSAMAEAEDAPPNTGHSGLELLAPG